MGRGVFLGDRHAHLIEAGSQRHRIFRSHNYARMVWPRATKFITVTHVGRSVFLGVRAVFNAPAEWVPWNL